MRNWNWPPSSAQRFIAAFRAYLWGIETRQDRWWLDNPWLFRAYLWGIETLFVWDALEVPAGFRAYLWGLKHAKLHRARTLLCTFRAKIWELKHRLLCLFNRGSGFRAYLRIEMVMLGPLRKRRHSFRAYLWGETEETVEMPHEIEGLERTYENETSPWCNVV